MKNLIGMWCIHIERILSEAWGELQGVMKQIIAEVISGSECLDDEVTYKLKCGGEDELCFIWQKCGVDELCIWRIISPKIFNMVCPIG